MNTDYRIEALEILLKEDCVLEKYIPLIAYRETLINSFANMGLRFKSDCLALSDDVLLEAGLANIEMVHLFRQFLKLYDIHPNKLKEIDDLCSCSEKKTAFRKLYYLPGVKKTRAELYYQCGFDTLEKIACASPDDIIEKMAHVIKNRNLDMKVPFPKEAKTHIAVAKAYTGYYIKEINRNSYDRIAGQWDDYRKARPVNQCIVDFSRRINANGRILDIGCGSGYPIDAYLNNQGFHVVGIDLSDEMISLANALCLEHASFQKVDFMGFKSNDTYDAIIAFDSLWHIRQEDQPGIYEKAASLLVENGYFLFTHGLNNGTVRGTMFSHPFIYSALDKDKLREILFQNGFEIVHWYENYQEITTGTRDLLVIAKKVRT